MKKEQAEKILDPETSRDALLEYEDEERIEAVNEACRLAVSALRAQQAKLDRSRWEGCEYCNNTLKDYRYISACDIGKRCLIYDVPRCCPICGRPLTEEAWADLERRVLENDEKADTH